MWALEPTGKPLWPTGPDDGPKALGKRLAHGAPIGRPYGTRLLRSLGVLWTVNADSPPQSHDEGRRSTEHCKFGPHDGAQANIRPRDFGVQLCLDPGLIGREVHYSADAKFLIASALMR